MAVVFVFGSNLAGRHGRGAALEAVQKWGAVYGEGVGRFGNSYAIPTKDAQLRVLPFPVIRNYTEGFVRHASLSPNDMFVLTGIGTGLAGYEPRDIAPLFYGVPDNVYVTGKLYNA